MEQEIWDQEDKERTRTPSSNLLMVLPSKTSLSDPLPLVFNQSSSLLLLLLLWDTHLFLLDGVHCSGSCTIENVWWEDVGEDAATFKGSDKAVYTVKKGGAKKASDKVIPHSSLIMYYFVGNNIVKVFQHNGGGTLDISDFEVSDFGKLYRSCGNCATQYKRTVNINVSFHYYNFFPFFF